MQPFSKSDFHLTVTGEAEDRRIGFDDESKWSEGGWIQNEKQKI